jgi:GNAT superfamily N-acetyltransferase
VLIIRRITPADAPALAEAFATLSEESRRLRFMTSKPRLTAGELRYFTDVDGHDHEALAAVDPETGAGVGIARFVRDPEDPTRAEVAVTVADQWQHRGVATLLLDRLGERARAEGVRRYTALVSADNGAMLQLLGRLGAPVRVSAPSGPAAEYEIALGPRGLGEQLVGALRNAAAGRLAPPPGFVQLLRGLVPLPLTGGRRRPGERHDDD